MHRSLCSLLLCSATATGLAQSPSRPADGPKHATIVYDAVLREFRCWTDGAIDARARGGVCDPGARWHPMSASLFFVRGQSVNVLVVNGVAQDVFSLEVKADDLAEPTTPVSGTFVDVPKLQEIPAAAGVFAGVGAAFVGGAATVKPSTRIYALLPTASPADFKAALRTLVLDPLAAKEISDLLAVDVNAAITTAGTGAAFADAANALLDEVKRVTVPATMPEWATTTKSFARTVDRATGLRTRIVAAGLPAAGKTLNDAGNALRSGPVRRALDIDPNDLRTLTADLTNAFAVQPYAKIASIGVSSNRFHSGDALLDALLKKVNDAIGTVPRTAALRTQLKANLTTLADSLPSIQVASRRRTDLATLEGNVNGATAITSLRDVLFTMTDTLTAIASRLNEAGKRLPLEAPYDVLPVGQWYATKTVTITLKQGQRLPMFDVGGVSDASRVGLTTGEVPAAKATSVAAGDLAAQRTLTVPVYNLYHVKLGVGFAYSTIRDERFDVTTATTGSGDAAVTQQFIDQTRARDYNLVPTANVTIFPWARHEFPSRARYEGERLPSWYHDVGAMIGLGLKNPGRDFLFGITWLPRNAPIGAQLAYHLGIRDYPPAGVAAGQPVTDRLIVLRQRALHGVSGGAVLTTDFFGKVFSSILKAAT
jgi:hypothetical protein